VVVVLPSPAGVGLIAVTRISLPSGWSAIDLMKSAETLALYAIRAAGSCPIGMPSFDAPISWIGFLYRAA
jgi:hypothetical protein